jgi:hypothetical protein
MSDNATGSGRLSHSETGVADACSVLIMLDTSPEAAQIQALVYRRMGSERRLEIADS